MTLAGYALLAFCSFPLLFCPLLYLTFSLVFLAAPYLLLLSLAFPCFPLLSLAFPCFPLLSLAFPCFPFALHPSVAVRCCLAGLQLIAAQALPGHVVIHGNLMNRVALPTMHHSSF